MATLPLVSGAITSKNFFDVSLALAVFAPAEVSFVRFFVTVFLDEKMSSESSSESASANRSSIADFGFVAASAIKRDLEF